MIEQQSSVEVGIRGYDVEWLDGKPSGTVYGIAITLEPFDHFEAARSLVQQCLREIGAVDTAASISKHRAIAKWDDDAGHRDVAEIHVSFQAI
jgi:hypothetical protein